MTKYCSFFINNLSCTNSECLYLHKLASDSDTFSKEENLNTKKILKVEPQEIIEFLLKNKSAYLNTLKKLEKLSKNK